MKIEKLKVGLGIIWLEYWMTSTTSRWPSFVVKSYWKMLYIYIYKHTHRKHIFFIGQTWFSFSLKNIHKCTYGIFSKKKKKKKCTYCIISIVLLILRMVFHLSQSHLFLAGIGSSVHNLPMLSSFLAKHMHKVPHTNKLPYPLCLKPGTSW